MEEMIQKGIQLGLPAMCFTEHLDPDFPEGDYSFDLDLPAYEKKLRELISSALNQLTFYGRAMNMEYAELDRRFAEINEYISEIKEKASGYEAIFEIHLNEIKLLLSGKVYELFGMEYTYDIAELRQSMLMMTKEEFMKQVDDICADLKDTLDRVLLYREENAYVVVRKTSALKRLAKNLKKIQSGLED